MQHAHVAWMCVSQAVYKLVTENPVHIQQLCTVSLHPQKGASQCLHQGLPCGISCSEVRCSSLPTSTFPQKQQFREGPPPS